MSAPGSERLFIRGGRVITPSQVMEPGMVVIEEGRIVAVEERWPPGPVKGAAVDAEGLTVVPGFIDVHVHGAVGHDTMDATSEAIVGMTRFLARHGVTGFVPTTMTAGREDILAAVRNIADFVNGEGAEVLGTHLEGPYISQEERGAQPASHVRPADREEYKTFQRAGSVRMITLAPEIEENRELIPLAVEDGAAVAVGHSAATYGEVVEAVSLGLSQATHTFNGMGGLHHRRPGTAGAALSRDEIYAQVIVDLVHVHPAVVKLLVRAKGPERTVLITDAMRAAGMPDGTYDLGGQEVTVEGGEARSPTGSLAGSTLTMDRAVRNVMEATDLSLPEALRMATLTPTRSIGVDDRKGSLERGKDADIVLLDEQLEVAMTIAGGEVVYRAEESPV